MTTFVFSNNASTTLAGSINSTATTINLATGTGSLFPTPSAGQVFAATLIDNATGLVREIVYVTGRSGDSVTVIRGEEGTSAVSWAAGDIFAHQWTAGQAAAMQQSANLPGAVSSFNTRTGAITLSSGDVVTALGYTPQPNGAVSSFNSRSGAVTLNSTDVNNALGFNPAPASAATPTGAVLMWTSSTAIPAGYLVCNGQAISRTTYAALYTLFGTFYGAGDGSTTFNIPDLRGYFVRGWDNGAGRDTGRAFGTIQTDAMQGHIHQWNINTAASGTTTSFATGGNNTIYQAPSGTPTSSPVTDGTNGTPRTAAETRPVNIALVYLIKT